MLLMHELLVDVCNAVLMFVSGAGCSRARRGAGRVQAQVAPDCRRLADVATQHRGQPWLVRLARYMSCSVDLASLDGSITKSCLRITWMHESLMM